MQALMLLSEAQTRSTRSWFHSDLAAIGKDVKAKCDEYDVTGYMTYHHGLFLQYIEGNESVVQQLKSEILLDARQGNFKLVLDQNIDQRSFITWRTRLVGDLKKDSTYKMFLNRFANHFVAGSDIEKVLFESFNIPQMSFDEVA